MHRILLFTRTSMEVIQVSSLWNAPLHSACYCSRAEYKELNIVLVFVRLTPHSLFRCSSRLCICPAGGDMQSAAIHDIHKWTVFSHKHCLICKVCWIKKKKKEDSNQFLNSKQHLFRITDEGSAPSSIVDFVLSASCWCKQAGCCCPLCDAAVGWLHLMCLLAPIVLRLSSPSPPSEFNIWKAWIRSLPLFSKWKSPFSPYMIQF